MSKIKKEQISAKGFAIQVYTEDFRNDYISLTDIARYKNVFWFYVKELFNPIHNLFHNLFLLTVIIFFQNSNNLIH